MASCWRKNHDTLILEIWRWKWLERIDRVYDGGRAVEELGWNPEYTFERTVEMVEGGREWRSEVALTVGKRGYRVCIRVDSAWNIRLHARALPDDTLLLDFGVRDGIMFKRTSAALGR